MFGEIKSNLIEGNSQQGIYCGGIPKFERENRDATEMKSHDASVVVISNNTIFQNGLSGLNFDGGSFELSGNTNVDNWLWGLFIQSRSSTYLVGNDIFGNKCGGIRIGVNYSGSVIIDGHTIRDTAPDILALVTNRNV